MLRGGEPGPVRILTTTSDSVLIASSDIVDEAVRPILVSNEIRCAAARISAAMLGKEDPVGGLGPPWASPLYIRASETFW